MVAPAADAMCQHTINVQTMSSVELCMPPVDRVVEWEEDGAEAVLDCVP